MQVEKKSSGSPACQNRPSVSACVASDERAPRVSVSQAPGGAELLEQQGSKTTQKLLESAKIKQKLVQIVQIPVPRYWKTK